MNGQISCLICKKIKIHSQGMLQCIVTRRNRLPAVTAVCGLQQNSAFLKNNSLNDPINIADLTVFGKIHINLGQSVRIIVGDKNLLPAAALIHGYIHFFLIRVSKDHLFLITLVALPPDTVCSARQGITLICKPFLFYRYHNPF